MCGRKALPVRVMSGAILGIDGYRVDVEVDLARGLPSYTIVGLAEVAVREAKDRVRSAIVNSGFDYPRKRITINLAPADIKKEGVNFDLPVAIGLLSASGIIDQKSLLGYLLIGELSLDGTIRPIRGCLPLVLAASQLRVNAVIVPEENSAEAGAVRDTPIYCARSLGQVVAHFRDGEPLPLVPRADSEAERTSSSVDLTDVKGQEHAKRALEIAAAGGHNLLMIGPPGSGKTMLARRLVSILPPMTFAESVETTKIYSIMGMAQHRGLIWERPFRAPHHTVSDAGLIGGGSHPRPGEVSLAHNGTLFLDELAEFRSHVLEVLRQPLEDRSVTISRASMSLTFPASFTLIAAMNPCPCGYLGDERHPCTCGESEVQRYRYRISGPLLDRIDIHIDVPAVPFKKLSEQNRGEPSATIRDRVCDARDRQHRRFRSFGQYTNATMPAKLVEAFCQCEGDGNNLLREAVDRLGLSARAYDRVLKVSRTIADLEKNENINVHHIAEAIQYRVLDRRLRISG